MKLQAFLLLAALLRAQKPVEVVPCRTGAEPAGLPLCQGGGGVNLNYVQPYFDALAQTGAINLSMRQLAIQRDQLDLAKKADRRAQEEHDVAMGRTSAPRDQDGLDLRNRIQEQLRARNATLYPRLQVADWKINQSVISAFSAEQTAHPDFDALKPAMEIVASGIKPDWQHVTVAEYLESLYAIAKYAAFSTPARDALLARPNK